MADDWTLYDQNGEAIAYIDSNGDIYLYDDTPVGYLDDDRESVYAYSGQHLGWFMDGWVRDNEGACVYFTDLAQGGPVRPVRQVRPVKGVRGVRPVRGVRQVRPIRPGGSLGWSRLMNRSFFQT
jgi:4-fold beta-flower domain-containing protein